MSDDLVVLFLYGSVLCFVGGLLGYFADRASRRQGPMAVRPSKLERLRRWLRARTFGAL